MLSYPDTVSKSETTPGTQDPVTGLMTPGSETVVWSAACDVQDDTLRTAHSTDGDQHLVSGARVWLDESADLSPVQSGDRLEVTQTAPNGQQVERVAEVLDVEVFEARLTVKWL